MHYITRRALQAVPTVLVVIILDFVLVRLAPGNPIAYILSNTEDAPPQLVQFYIHLYGLDQPIYVQLESYLWRLLHGDLGYSFTYNAPVDSVLMPRIAATLLLTMAALSIQLLLGVGLGMLAVRSSKLKGVILNIFSIIAWSAPSFWVAMILAIIFGIYFHLFPVTGMESVGVTGWASVPDILWHLVLPAASLALAGFGLYFRIMRAGFLEVLQQDYVTTARAKGCNENRILFKHVFKNALLPLITVVGTNAGFLITGAALIEVVFGWPGIGYQLDLAINARDYAIIEAIFVVVALMVIVANLLADILYTFVDPRVRFK